MQYGTFSNGGYPAGRLGMILRKQPIPMPSPVRPFYHTLVHEDDLIAFVEPRLMAASLDPITISWGGDDGVSA